VGTRLVGLQPLLAFDLARLSGPFTLVGQVLAAIGERFPLVCRPIAMVSESLTPVPRIIPTASASLTHLQPALADLEVELARVRLGLARIDGVAVRIGRVIGQPLSLGLDHFSPSALEHRPLTLVRRELAMELSTRCVRLLLPEPRGFLVTGRRFLVACGGSAMTFG
jgi:hypothetical protein